MILHTKSPMILRIKRSCKILKDFPTQDFFGQERNMLRYMATFGRTGKQMGLMKSSISFEKNISRKASKLALEPFDLYSFRKNDALASFSIPAVLQACDKSLICPCDFCIAKIPV